MRHYHIETLPKNIETLPHNNETPQIKATTLIYLNLQHPVRLGLEGLDLVMSFNTEAQGGSLTRSVRDQCTIQVAILSLWKTSRNEIPKAKHKSESFRLHILKIINNSNNNK